MDLFDWTIKETMHATDEVFNWKLEQREEKYKAYKLNSGPKQITITSDGWISDNGNANLRFARFHSKIIDVVTVMIYPTASPDLIPVFAAEFVAVSGNIHVVVVDVKFLDESVNKNSENEMVIKWKKKFKDKEVIPEWFLDIKSDKAIFSSCVVEELQNVQSMFNDYLHYTTLNYYKPLNAKSKTGKDHELVAKYKRHHAINSPAHKIVSAENLTWLNEFLFNNHFKVID